MIIAVIIVIPSFGYFNLCFLSIMSVNKVITVCTCFVAIYLVLTYCINNFSICIILRKIVKNVIPVSICIRNHLLTYNFVICQKFYSDTCRSDSILIVCIIPGFRTADIDCSFINVFENNCIRNIATSLDCLTYIQGSVSNICYCYLYGIYGSIISNFSVRCLNL